MCEFGAREPKIRFQNKCDFYRSVGLIARGIETGTCYLVYEENHLQGAWAEEYRIGILSNPNGVFDSVFPGKVMKGTGGLVGRINNNEYIRELIASFGLPIGKGQSIDTRLIRQSIPGEYQGCFQDGYDLL